MDFEFRVLDFGFRVLDFVLRVWDFGVWSLLCGRVSSPPCCEVVT